MLHFDGSPVDPEVLERMVLRLRHRGPDDAGTYVNGAVGLGHARLSIVDVATGHQPMSSADGRLWITFNGEIFNYIELRQELVARGHRFATQSDTEVILRLYEEHGADCVHRLNGQWAFAIWDASRRQLLLSRDRLGILPLFYTETGSALLFASEVKALFSHPAVDRAIDPHALDQLFTFWTPLPGRTTFAGVREVLPGHTLTVAAGCVSTRRYWQLDFTDIAPISEDEASDRLLDLLSDATRIRLRADVSVGAYLSGGLDSSTVAALLARCSSEDARTFSVTFDDSEFDESSYQREMAAHLGVEHDEVRCTATDIGRIFPEVVWHTERPVLRTAPAPLFLLSRMVADRGYKVVLTGEGADEVLGGYDIFKEAKIRRFMSRCPSSRRRPSLLRRLYPYLPALQTQPDAYLAAFFRAGDADDPCFSHVPRWNSTSQLKRFYSADLRARMNGYDARSDLRNGLPPRQAAWDPLARAQYLETAHLLPGYILGAQGDRMAMAHGVEQRFPFLDHRVVEFGASLPPRLRMKVLQEKYLLKHATAGLVPDRIRLRSKQPYRAPDAPSFISAHGQSPDYVSALLSPARVREDGLFDPAAVDGLVAKLRSGRPIGMRDHMALVGILSTQLVVDQFIRNFKRADDSKRDTRIRHRKLPLRPSAHSACV